MPSVSQPQAALDTTSTRPVARPGSQRSSLRVSPQPYIIQPSIHPFHNANPIITGDAHKVAAKIKGEVPAERQTHVEERARKLGEEVGSNIDRAGAKIDSAVIMPLPNCPPL